MRNKKEEGEDFDKKEIYFSVGSLEPTKVLRSFRLSQVLRKYAIEQLYSYTYYWKSHLLSVFCLSFDFRCVCDWKLFLETEERKRFRIWSVRNVVKELICKELEEEKGT